MDAEKQGEIDSIVRAMEKLVERLCVLSNRERVDNIIEYLRLKNTAKKIVKRSR